jgi:hypothetical protein
VKSKLGMAASQRNAEKSAKAKKQYNNAVSASIIGESGALSMAMAAAAWRETMASAPALAQ